jgi:hypothetical protein
MDGPIEFARVPISPMATDSYEKDCYACRDSDSRKWLPCLSWLYRPDHAGRVTRNYGIWRHILHDDRPSADNCSVPNCYPGADEGVSADPGVVPDHDGRLQKGSRVIANIMRSCAKVRPLGHRRAITDRDGAKRVETRPVANGAI